MKRIFEVAILKTMVGKETRCAERRFQEVDDAGENCVSPHSCSRIFCSLVYVLRVPLSG